MTQEQLKTRHVDPKGRRKNARPCCAPRVWQRTSFRAVSGLHPALQPLPSLGGYRFPEPTTSLARVGPSGKPVCGTSRRQGRGWTAVDMASNGRRRAGSERVGNYLLYLTMGKRTFGKCVSVRP